MSALSDSGEPIGALGTFRKLVVLGGSRGPMGALSSFRELMGARFGSREHMGALDTLENLWVHTVVPENL